METNQTNITNIEGDKLWYYENRETFWVLVSISVLIALTGAVGNAFVIFAAIQRRNIASSFRYLNRVVLSLAIADFSYSLIGTPFYVVHWYWGKLHDLKF